MAKFVFLSLGALLLIAGVITLLQYLGIALLKRHGEKNTEKHEDE
jgi:hypothetical protein